MSETATPVTPAHLDYIRARTDAEGPFLEDLRRAAVASGIPSIAIAVEQGSFLATLVRVSRAHDIVEVGTLAGYSALWMARGLPEGGRIVTIEKSPNHAAFAREWAGKSPWADKVKVVEGAGSAVLPTLPSSAFDGVFLDQYLISILRLLIQSRFRRIYLKSSSINCNTDTGLDIVFIYFQDVCSQ